MYKQNLHIHSCYCDGKNTPEETVKKAIELGFDSIGFSGHSYMHYSTGCGMKPDNEIKYRAEIERLKGIYSDKMKLFCGIEYDMYSDIDISYYDYAIGSVHYFLIGGKHIGFDRTANVVKDIINTHFQGDGLKCANMYYETLSRLPEYGKFDIIGHFDIITKNVELVDLFDIESKEYLGYAFEAINNLKGKIPFFEVNTGAIARGYRKTPYPSVPILKELKNAGFGAVITTDCHDAEMLDCYFDESKDLLKTCGFKDVFILTDNGFRPERL